MTLKVKDNYAQVEKIIQLDDQKFDFSGLTSALKFFDVKLQRCPSMKHVASMAKFITGKDNPVYKIVDKRTRKVNWEGIQDV